MSTDDVSEGFKRVSEDLWAGLEAEVEETQTRLQVSWAKMDRIAEERDEARELLKELAEALYMADNAMTYFASRDQQYAAGKAVYEALVKWTEYAGMYAEAYGFDENEEDTSDD